MAVYKGKVLENSKISDTVHRLKVLVRPDQNLSYKPGQFMIVEIPKPEGQVASPDQKSPKGYYSIASAPNDEGTFEFLVEHREGGGEVSTWMTQRKANDRLVLEGPLGKLALGMPDKRTQVFLAYRAGVAPLRALIQAALAVKSQHPVYLFLGGTGTQDLLLDDEWRALAKSNKRFNYIPSADPAATLLSEIPERLGIDLYLAGFKRELDPMKNVLLDAGFPKIDLRMESFG